jgi:hypothetical protein
MEIKNAKTSKISTKEIKNMPRANSIKILRVKDT